MILEGDRHPGQPFPHLTEFNRNLHAGLRRGNLCNLAPLDVEQSERTDNGPLQFALVTAATRSPERL